MALALKPSGLIADVLVPAPDMAWSKARAIAGPSSALLPSRFALFVAVALGLPITAAENVDGASPLVLSIGELNGQFAVVGSLRLKSSGRFLAATTTGQAARFERRDDPSTGLALLEPKSKFGALVIGLFGDALVIGASASELAAFAPYVARSLSGRAMPPEDVVIEASAEGLRGPLRERFKREWEGIRPSAERAAAEHGVAPLLSLSAVAEGALAWLDDLGGARIGMRIEDAAVHVETTLNPRTEAGPLSRYAPVGGASNELLRLPASTALGVAWSDTVQARASSADLVAERLADGMREVLSASDRARFSAAIAQALRARGDGVACGWAADEASPRLDLCASVTDRDLLAASLRDVFSLVKKPCFGLALKDLGVALSSTGTPPAPASDSWRIRLRSVAANGDRTPGRREVLVRMDDMDLEVALPPEGMVASARRIAAVGTPSPSRGEAPSLASRPFVRASLEALGDRVSFAALFDPSAFAAALAGRAFEELPAPIVLASGRPADLPQAVRLRIDASAEAVRVLVRQRIGR